MWNQKQQGQLAPRGASPRSRLPKWCPGLQQPPTARKCSSVRGGCLGSLLQALVSKLFLPSCCGQSDLWAWAGLGHCNRWPSRTCSSGRWRAASECAGSPARVSGEAWKGSGTECLCNEDAWTEEFLSSQSSARPAPGRLPT